jgi:hypothetical protein
MSFLFPGKNTKDGFYLNLLLLEKEFSVFFVSVDEAVSKTLFYKNVEHNLDISKGIDSEKLTKLKSILSKLLSLAYTEAVRVSGKKSLKLEDVAVILGYPWFYSDDMHFSFTGKDISISEGELLENIDKRFQEDEGKKAGALKPALLERYVNEVRLNGYKVRNPYGKKTERIEASVTTISFFPEIEHVLDKEIAAFFHGVRSRFLSLPKVFYHQGVNANYLVMDSSNTLLVHSCGGAGVKAREINYGVAEMVKAAAEVFGSESESNAISYLKMAKEDVLLDSVSSKVLAAVRERMVDWKFLLKKSLTELDGEEGCPLFIVYRRGLSSFTSNFIKGELPLEGDVFLLELETLCSDPGKLCI